MRPNTGPFADLQMRPHTPPIRPSTTYSLSDSNTEEQNGAAPPYNGYHERMNTEYTGTSPHDLSHGYGGPDRASSPDSRSSEQDSWKHGNNDRPLVVLEFGDIRRAKLSFNRAQCSAWNTPYQAPSRIQYKPNIVTIWRAAVRSLLT